MSGIGVGVFLSVCRLLVDFRDDLGNLKSISGTGFWIVDRNDSFFVTNRHNVDPTLKLGSDTKFHTETVKLQLRTQTTPTAWGPGTAFVAVENLNFALRSHPTADVAILANPLLPPGHMVLNHGGFTLEEIATEYFLANSVGPMDVGSFVGFPGKDGKAWWDERWDFPIARTVNIASWPRIPFSNSAILTTDTVLVSGLSFSGSSGSPVISHEKGIKVGGALTGDGYVEPKLLGIMSGHWWNEEPTNGMFFHSGLSYFTRSTSIHELLTA